MGESENMRWDTHTHRDVCMLKKHKHKHIHIRTHTQHTHIHIYIYIYTHIYTPNLILNDRHRRIRSLCVCVGGLRWFQVWIPQAGYGSSFHLDHLGWSPLCAICPWLSQRQDPPGHPATRPGDLSHQLWPSFGGSPWRVESYWIPINWNSPLRMSVSPVSMYVHRMKRSE